MDFCGKNLENVHIGNMICEWLRNNKITKTKFSQIMEMPPTNANRLLKNKSMDVVKLMGVSMALKHNFFAEICRDPDYYDNLFFNPPMIGRAIENQLKIKGITQTDFAGLLKMHQPDVSRLLKKMTIDSDKLFMISRILDFNFFRLFYPIDEPDTETTEIIEEDFVKLTIAEIQVRFNEMLDLLQVKSSELEKVQKENLKLKSELSKLQRKNTALRKQMKDAGLEVD